MVEHHFMATHLIWTPSCMYSVLSMSDQLAQAHTLVFPKINSLKTCTDTFYCPNSVHSNDIKQCILYIVLSFSSKRGHVTEKHVLIGCKHNMFGSQTFEV